jgi:hypothetical protein
MMAPSDRLALLVKVGERLYGERWQTQLARELGIRDTSRIRGWLRGDRPVPDGVVADLPAILRRHAKACAALAAEVEAITAPAGSHPT